MRGVVAIFKREVFGFFVSPMAWVVITTFLLIQGLHFYFVFLHYASQVDVSADGGPVQAFFGQTVILYLPLTVMCPLLTMRLFAEERRTGTIEALLTTPVSSAAVVFGKYGAVMLTYLVMWAPTAMYMWLAGGAGYVDWNVVGSGYLAVLLVGAGYLAVGTMTSALTKTQLSAAVLSAMVLMTLFLVGLGEFMLPESPIRDVCGYLSVWGQMNDFSRGVVDSRRLVFDLSAIALPLFVTVRAVDAWRLE
jgi:ABC-2 type transport system permease protein